MKDMTIRGGNRRPVQQARVYDGGWTKAKRKTFCDMLATTCNVRASCAAAQMHPTSAYMLRRRDATFAALWQEALEIGYDKLEQAILEQALIGVNAIEIDASIPVEIVGDSSGISLPSLRPAQKVDVAVAMQMLARHRATVVAGAAVPVRSERATSQETDKALMQRLDTLRRQQERRV